MPTTKASRRISLVERISVLALGHMAPSPINSTEEESTERVAYDQLCQIYAISLNPAAQANFHIHTNWICFAFSSCRLERSGCIYDYYFNPRWLSTPC